MASPASNAPWSCVRSIRTLALRHHGDRELRPPKRSLLKVVVFHASANFDPAVSADPMRFDIARRPNDHVAFGDGPHVCPGAHFARLQVRLLFREALWRMTDLELAGPPHHLVSNFINGIKHLPLRFTPGGRTA
jgi:hypothetical protein